jgi:hypothetical protein
MHLPAPYVGVGAYRIDHGSAVDQPRPYVVPPCDATLAAEGGVEPGRPGVHPEHLALVYESWLRRLADSAWWSGQIPGVRFDLLAGVPAGLASAPVKPRVVQVTVDRGGSHVLHLRARVGGLIGSRCPGATQYEFSWVNGELMAANIAENPELLGPDECPAGNRVREAMWWQGRLVSYTGPLPGGQVEQWTHWQQEQPACQGDMTPGTPDVGDLQRAAALWFGYAQTAPVLPPEKDAY